MTFEELCKANETIKTTKIKGKEYAEVNERIRVFRMLYPNGSILTEFLSDVDGKCIIKATVTDEKGTILATGTAYEKEGNNLINSTSYIENCETSAVGRALGMLGIGINTSVASYEEVGNAIEQQKSKEKIDKQRILTITELCKEVGEEIPENLEKWSKGKADKAISALMAKRNKND